MKLLTTAIAAVILTTLLGIGGSYYLGLRAISQSQRNWCTTLTLLTAKPVAKPVNPAANPSRENSYLFYVHLRELEDKFGC